MIKKKRRKKPNSRGNGRLSFASAAAARGTTPHVRHRPRPRMIPARRNGSRAPCASATAVARSHLRRCCCYYYCGRTASVTFRYRDRSQPVRRPPSDQPSEFAYSAALNDGYFDGDFATTIRVFSKFAILSYRRQ